MLLGLLIAAFAAGTLADPRCDTSDRARLIAEAGLLPLGSAPQAPQFQLPDLSGGQERVQAELDARDRPAAAR